MEEGKGYDEGQREHGFAVRENITDYNYAPVPEPAHAELSFFQKITIIQTDLYAPKDLKNTFGNYNYRSAESIIASLRPYLRELSLFLEMSDKIVVVGERYYVEATVSLADGLGNRLTAVAYGREQEDKKGMDQAQVTGATSSYARKYALSALLGICGEEDPDAKDNRDEGKRGAKEKLAAPPLSREKFGRENAEEIEALVNEIVAEIKRICINKKTSEERGGYLFKMANVRVSKDLNKKPLFELRGILARLKQEQVLE